LPPILRAEGLNWDLPMARIDQENQPLTPEEEQTLAAYLAAGRADEAPPSDALMAAILADGLAAMPPHPVARPLRRPAARHLSDRWSAAVALAAAAAVGFWIGLAGQLEVIDPTAWTGVGLTEAEADPVAGFFDLAAVENAQ
jgi:hypothetical protein